jgi:hypothetical protein
LDCRGKERRVHSRSGPAATVKSMNEIALFDFESDFVATLRCIPMAVRFKLDRVGVKLSLRQWSRLNGDERQALLLAPCQSSIELGQYRGHLVRLLNAQGQQDAAPLPPGATVEWGERDRTPDQVRSFALDAGVQAPSDTAWRRLTDLQRFALLKLSRDNHDNVNFIPALREFGLLQSFLAPPSATS